MNMQHYNKAFKKLTDENYGLYTDEEFMAVYVAELPFENLRDLYSQQLPDDSNVLDNTKVIEAILSKNDVGKSLVVAMYARGGDLWEFCPADTVLKIANISAAHKKAILANVRIDWYRLMTFEEGKLVQELLGPIFLDEELHDYRKIVLQNPRMDRKFLAKVISGQGDFASIDIRSRILHYGCYAAITKEIKSHDWPEKDSPDNNELYFNYPLKALLRQMYIAFSQPENTPWLKYTFNASFIAGYLRIYSLPIDWPEWLTNEQKAEIEKIQDWQEESQTQHKVARESILRWLTEIGPTLKDRVEDDGPDYINEEAFFSAVSYKLFKGDPDLIARHLKSPIEILRIGAYAAKFDQHPSVIPKEYYGCIKKALKQSSDTDAIVKGLALSNEFWELFRGAMHFHFKKYTWLDDLLKSVGVDCSDDAKSFFHFCKVIFLPEDKENELIEAFVNINNPIIYNPNQTPEKSPVLDAIAALSGRVQKQEKTIVWILWIAVISLGLMVIRPCLG